MPASQYPEMQSLWKSAFWILAVATLCLSLMPADRLPPSLDFWDKAQHALGFAGLALLGLLGFAGRSKELLWGLVLYGASIEVAQHLTGWRFGDPADWLADCLGIGLGWLLWRAWQFRQKY